MSQLYTTLDQADIMDSLALFMRNQTEFKDFDFDGSAMRELMRLLAFNSQQQGYESNFIYNELQIDSAQLRQNLTSLVSRLGYIPQSVRAAKLAVTITVVPSDINTAPSTLLMTRDTTFYATTDGSALLFSPDHEYTATLSNGSYTFSNVTLLQGTWAANSYVVQTTDGIESYVLPNTNIDTTTLDVAVRASGTSAVQASYAQFKTAYDLGQDAQLYFIRENRNGFYEIKFGDNRFAKRLDYGNIVTVRYLVTDASAGNNMTALTPAGPVGGYFNVSITNLDTKSYGGDDAETMDSIRTMAPLGFVASGNAVTPGDYVFLTKNQFTEAGDVISWGGEDNTPPRYGYVMVSVKPKNSETLSPVQKSALVTLLSQYKVGSISPIIVDPDYTYINVNTQVKINSKLLSITQDALKAKVSDYSYKYSKQKLETFSGELDMSKFAPYVTSIDPSITGNYTTISYEKRFVPVLNQLGSYDLLFNHTIAAGSLLLTGFSVSDSDFTDATYNIKDDGAGKLFLNRVTDSGTTTIQVGLGTVDYSTGTVKIVSFRPSSLVGDYITATANPGSGDTSMVASKNTILKFNQVNVNFA